MKKILSVALVMILAFSLVACGGEKENAKKYDIADSTALLTAVWDNVPEDKKFMSMGGDGQEAFVENAPGAYTLSDPEALESVFGFPADQVANIDNAASLMHGMMQNHFTAGAYHVKDAATIGDVTAAIQTSLENMRWICGTPEKFAIYTVDDYVISVYGLKDNLDSFAAALKTAYPEFVTVCDKNIAE